MKNSSTNQHSPPQKNTPISSVVEGNNADLLREVARLYATPDTKIADLTFGKGVFWRRTPHLDVTGSDLLTVPERPYDFRRTPYADDQFDVAVLDPPYIHDGGTHVTEHRYQGKTTRGLNHAGIRQLYVDGMREAMRITHEGGQIWVKCKDEIESGIQCYAHLEIAIDAADLGLYGRDLFTLIATNRTPQGRWSIQVHARKPQSYLWIFERRRTEKFRRSLLSPVKPSPRIAATRSMPGLAKVLPEVAEDASEEVSNG